MALSTQTRRPSLSAVGCLDKLGAMAIPYNWTCTACGATNAAGIDVCSHCGSNAVTSAFDIETGANKRRTPPFSLGERLVSAALLLGYALFLIFNPPQTAWWVGIGLFAAAFALMCVARWLRRSK